MFWEYKYIIHGGFLVSILTRLWNVFLWPLTFWLSAKFTSDLLSRLVELTLTLLELELRLVSGVLAWVGEPTSVSSLKSRTVERLEGLFLSESLQLDLQIVIVMQLQWYHGHFVVNNIKYVPVI